MVHYLEQFLGRYKTIISSELNHVGTTDEGSLFLSHDHIDLKYQMHDYSFPAQ